MFTDKNIRFHIQKATLKTEERKKDERFPVFDVALVLEPLTRELAAQLGPDIASHCFAADKRIRDEMKEVKVVLREKEHALTVAMAEDVEPHCVLRQVRLVSVKVARRGEDDKVERKGKKIAPQEATLRLTLKCLIDPAEKVHRDFFCRFIGDTFAFTFEPEDRDLFAGLHTEPEDEKDDNQPKLRPAPGDEAGDVLEEQATR